MYSTEIVGSHGDHRTSPSRAETIRELMKSIAVLAERTGSVPCVPPLHLTARVTFGCSSEAMMCTHVRAD